MKPFTLHLNEGELISVLFDLRAQYPKGIKAKAILPALLSHYEAARCPTCGRATAGRNIKLSRKEARRHYTRIGRKLSSMWQRGLIERVVVQELYGRAQFGYLPLTDKEIISQLPPDFQSIYDFKLSRRTP